MALVSNTKQNGGFWLDFYKYVWSKYFMLFQLLKAEMDQRHIGVVSLQESLRRDHGDQWKSDHLQVKCVWEKKQKLSFLTRRELSSDLILDIFSFPETKTLF